MAAEKRFLEVNKPLPWIEPSINMIHLDVVRSFVFGSALASIGCATYLLEHSLRMAICDPIESGSQRLLPTSSIFNDTWNELLTNERYSANRDRVIPDDDDKSWWDIVRKAVRNKVNHVDIPAVFRIANELHFEYDYAYSGSMSWDTTNPHSWGLFWHRYGDKLASDFINQSTKQVLKLINNTEWNSDVSWWESQKNEYDMFFMESWNFESLKKSLDKVYS
jgi:hypothetical protein